MSTQPIWSCVTAARHDLEVARGNDDKGAKYLEDPTNQASRLACALEVASDTLETYDKKVADDPTSAIGTGAIQQAIERAHEVFDEVSAKLLDPAGHLPVVCDDIDGATVELAKYVEMCGFENCT